MRSCRWSAALAAALVLAPALALAGADRSLAPAPDGDGPAGRDGAADALTVSAVSFGGGSAGGAALSALACGLLAARGVRARAAPPPAACAPPAPPDARACLDAALAALARGALHAALLPAPRAPAPPRLRDAGLEELDDAAPPARRACWARSAAARPRSLLDLADAELAARFHVPRAALLAVAPHRFEGGNSSAAEPAEDDKLATLLAADEAEAAVMRAVIREHALLAQAYTLPAGADAARVLAALAPRAALVCGRALDAAALGAVGAHALGPPPCLRADCPFEARRLLTLVNARSLARWPGAARALGRLALDEAELRTLETDGPRVALAARARAGAGTAPEVRVVAMLPASTRREAFAAPALRAAAELAEEDEARAAAAAGRAFDFKVELLDDACSGARAFKYLTDALGGEFSALSGVVGPACGAAFGDVARQSAALALPLVAYTAQAPPAGAPALLAAGDARRAAAAAAALLARLGWRRVAVLSELATRAALDPARLGDVLVHVELPPDGEDLDYALVVQWAARVVASGARIVYVCVEDARAARAALCAGRAAGLLPAAGAAWLLPAALPAAWLRRTRADAHPCSQDELLEVAEGHLSVAWEWQRARPPTAWAARWRARCERAGGAARCAEPPPHAALLYDALRLWATALARLLAARPAALDDLHRPELARALVEDAARAPYAGLTGPFEWEAAGEARARASALDVRQWRNGSHVVAGAWRGGALRLDAAALRWATADGRPPRDGAEPCALRALADALHADCRVAFVAAGALALAALVALLAAVAWQCRRRAERDFRARLAALGMRTLGPKPGGLDRWELARERVVINRKLGTGAFGTVYGGHALLAEDRGWSAVAVKTLKAGASTEEKLDFLSEAEAMKRFEHKNVVRLLGVVTQTEPVCTVMEFMLYGDLKGYLLARRQLAGAAGAAGAEVAPARLTAMALDVARALSYLAQLRYVHRDVAARNCLVSAHRVVKLADFGMTRLVFEHDYYRFSRKGLLPVRWMAPESLALGVFSPASDVWAFGVLLYEIVTFGSLPFQGLSNAEVLARVKAGRTLDLPPGLKPQLEGLIKSCWQQERRARPSAAAVAAFLADAPRLLAPCLDVPLDALPLELEGGAAGARDSAQARWVSWAAPTSAGTDSTYLSAEAAPRDCDAFLPPALR